MLMYLILFMMLSHMRKKARSVSEFRLKVSSDDYQFLSKPSANYSVLPSVLLPSNVKQYSVK